MLPGNALSNPGFEQGSQTWNLCSGSSQVITDPARAHSGSNFLWASTSVYACAITTQFVPVSPGEQVTFGGWTYLESGSSLLRWILVAYDINKYQVGAGVAASPTTVSTGIWTQAVGAFTVPAGAAYVQIYCEIYLPTTTTAARFDDGFITFGSSAATTPIYYVEDLLGTSRVTTTNTGVVCYDADFYPYGGERSYTNTCRQNNYKFEGKERDVETGNDDFGARYYSNRFGRWLSADWSSVPVAVPYANLSNPQTLNLYAMVFDDPESFADLDGHGAPGQGTSIQAGGTPTCASEGSGGTGTIATGCGSVPQPAEAAANGTPPPNANTIVAAIYRFGGLLGALGALGNGAEAAKNATDVTVSGQVGNAQVDSHGESSVVPVPAIAVNVNINVNGARPDQTLVQQPAVGVGKFVQLSTNQVRDANGAVHLQGGGLSIGLSTPTVPVSTAVPTGNVNNPKSPISRFIEAVKSFISPSPGASPLAVPWDNAHIL